MQVIDIDKDFSTLLYELTNATSNATTSNGGEAILNNQDLNNDHVPTRLDEILSRHSTPTTLSAGMTTEISSCLAEPSVSTRTMDDNTSSLSSRASPRPSGVSQMNFTEGIQGVGSQFIESDDSLEEPEDHIEKATTRPLVASDQIFIKTDSGVLMLLEFGSG